MTDDTPPAPPGEAPPLTKQDLERQTAAEALQKVISDRKNADQKAVDDHETAVIAQAKAKADAEAATATAVQAAETTRIAQDKSKLDNDTVKLSNEQKVREGKQADYDSLAAKVAAAVPKISEIPMNTLTVPAGTAFRESENVALVLDTAVKALVEDLKSSPSFPGSEPITIVLTSDSMLAQSAVAYFSLRAEITALTGQATSLNEAALALLDPTGSTPETTDFSGPGDVISAGVAAAATAVTEIAALFETDSTVTNVISEPSEFTVQAKLIRHIRGTFPGATIVLDRVSPISQDSELLELLESLLAVYGSLTDTSVLLSQKIVELKGDDNASLRAPYQAMKGRVDAVKSRVEALIAKITTVPSTGGMAPLTEAIIRSTTAVAGADTYVLIVPTAKVYTDQVVVKRRFAAPRLAVSTHIELPYVLLKGGHVVWASAPAARTGFTAKFAAHGVDTGPFEAKTFQKPPDPPVLPEGEASLPTFPSEDVGRHAASE
ncbi:MULTISPECIES: hypothetical protein [unclassified Leifsonia]|uniref:hypothetical protein n=1 Tax=unclassified Leifsonia TaxID=2663824 RepID=UPI0006F516B3|nr:MULTISPECIES: hypothetical protein [unclassified Leifsonia]KQX06648.1 hypothetical protein ASC59_01995 [Leifsonia sp. Root1293]KRA10932.1 hypothetical protein ASD61_01995 [Leifsonia sp. Root60]